MVRIYLLAIMLFVVGSVHSMDNEEVALLVQQNKRYELSQKFIQNSDQCPQRLKALVEGIVIDTNQRHIIDYYLDTRGKITALSIYSAERKKEGMDTFNVHCVPGTATTNMAKL